MVTLLHEISRRYIFPKGEFIEIGAVVDLEVSKSGGHRITTSSGEMFYIPFTWLAIKIDSHDGWEA